MATPVRAQSLLRRWNSQAPPVMRFPSWSGEILGPEAVGPDEGSGGFEAVSHQGNGGARGGLSCGAEAPVRPAAPDPGNLRYDRSPLIPASL